MDRFKREKLSADQRPRFLFTYYVTGSGAFPVDMLRYDAAWPASSEDAAIMGIDEFVSRDRNRRRSIKLHSYREPTVDRWSSFVWSVGDAAVQMEVEQ